MNSYELSRNFFDWSFENPQKITPNHIALYFFCIEHCNRLGWKKNFGLPTTMAKEAIGIRSYNTYIKTLNDLVQFGFIEMVEKSKNQYSSNIIALSNFNKALDNALDKALIKHGTKQSESTIQSIDSINKQETINKEQKNKEQAYDIILSNKSQDFEVFLMQNKSQIKDFNLLVETFNDRMDIELEQGKIEFTENQLKSRFKMYARSWIKNQSTETKKINTNSTHPANEGNPVA